MSEYTLAIIVTGEANGVAELAGDIDAIGSSAQAAEPAVGAFFEGVSQGGSSIAGTAAQMAGLDQALGSAVQAWSAGAAASTSFATSLTADSNGINALSQMLHQLGGAINAATPEPLVAAFNAATSAIAAHDAALNETFTDWNAVDAAMAQIEAAAHGLDQALGLAGQAAASAGQGIGTLDQSLGTVSQASASAGQGVTSLGQTLSGIAQSVANAAQSAGGFAQAVGGTITAAVSTARESISSFGQAVSSAAQPVISFAQTVSTGITGALGTAGQALSSFAQMFSPIGQAVAGAAQSVIGFAQSIGASLSSAFSSASAQISSVGSHIGGFFADLFHNAANIKASIDMVAGFGSAIMGVGQSLIAGSAEFEGYEARFASLMGSTDLAKAKIQELSTFASTTPFELPDVIKASQSLQVFGGAALNTKENLAIVGNAAAATGQNIGDVSFWFARAYSAIQNGQPFGEAAQNLQQMGVMSGDTVVKLNALKESGASNTEVWNQFAGSLNAPTDAMAKMGGTWTGLTSTLSDSWALLVRTFGQPLFETLKPQMQGVIDALSSGGLIEAVSSLGTAFASVLAPAVSFVADTVIPGVVAAIQFIAPAISEAISVLSQIGSIFGEMAGEALAWGANIINQLAAGIMSAAGPVIAAINSIGSVIAGLLMPGSPPAFLPALDQWGTGAMDAYLEGWGQADFGVFNSISEGIKGALDGIAKASGDKGMNVAGILLGSQDEIASAVNEVRQFGKVSEETFNSLVAAIGPAGPEVSGLVSAYLDLQAATQNVASAQNELNAVTEEYAGKLAPLNAQLKGIQNQKQAIQDQKKLADLQTKLADQSLSDADRQLAMLEQQEIMTRQQIRTTEADRDASVGASKAKLDAAKQEQAAAQARVNQQKALVDAQNKTNALIAEQTKAMAGAAGAMKGAASAAAPLAEAVQGVNQVVGSMKQTIEGAGSSIQSTGMVISTAFSPAVLFVKNNIDGLMGALSGIAAVLGAAAVWGVATSVITALGGAIAFLLSPIGLLIVGAAALGAAISTNFLGLGTLAQSLMATFSQLGGVLSQAFAAFQEGGLGAAIQTLVTGIGPILTQLGTTIVTWITTQGPIIAAQLLSWGTAFIEWITTTIPQVVTGLLGLATAIWEWIKGAAPQLATQLGEWAVAFVGWLPDAISQLLAGLAGVIGAITTWIVEHGPDIIATLASWGAGFGTWVLDTALPALLGALGELWTNFTGWLSENGPSILAQLSTWGAAFGTWVTETALPALTTALGELWTNFTGWLSENGPSILAQLGEWGAAFGGWVKDKAIPALTTALGELWTNFTGWLSENGPSILAQLGEWGAAFGTWVTETALPALTTALGELWTSFTGWLVEKGPGILAQLGEWAVAFGAWVKEKAWPFLLAALGDLFTNLTGWLREKGPGILAQLGEWGAAFGGWVKDKAIPALTTALGDLATKLFGWISEQAKKLIDSAGAMGKSLIDGFVKGIAGGVGRVIDAAKNMAKSVYDAAMGALQSHSPSKLFTKVGGTVPAGLDQGITAGMPKVTTNLVNGIMNLAGKAGAAIEAGTKAMSAAASYSGPGGTGLSGFLAGFSDLAIQFNDAAVALGGRILGTATRFADTIGKVTAPIDTALKALGGLVDFVAPARANISAFIASMYVLLNALNNMAAMFEAKAIKAAATFAEGAGKMLAVVGPAIDALKKLPDLVVPAQSQVNAFGESLFLIVRELLNVAALFAAQSLQAGAAFGEAGAKLLGVVAPAIDALKKLPELVVPADGALATFGDALGRTVQALIQVASLFAQDAVDAAAKFAESAGKVLSILKTGVDGLNAVREFGPIGYEAITAFAMAVDQMVSLMAQVADDVGVAATEAAAKFSEGAGKVLGILKSGVDGLAGVRDLGPIGYEAIETFTMAVDQIVAYMAMAAEDVGVAAVEAAARFAGGAGAVLAIVKNGVDGLLVLRDLGPIGYEAIESFTMAVDQIVAYMAMAAEDVGVAAADAAAKFSEGAGKVLAIVKSGVEGLIELRNLGPVGVTSITRFVMAVDQIVAFMAMAAEDVGVAAADAAAAFAAGAGKVLALLKTGVDGLTSLATFAAPAPKAIQAFGATIVAVLRQIELVSATFSAEAVASAATFATNVSTVVSQLKGALQAFASLGDTTVKPAVLNAFMQAAQSLIAQMAAYLPPNAEVIGSNTIVGLINGIVGQRANLIAAITNTVLAAVIAAEQTLGIASPSTVFDVMGAQSGAGYVGGAERMQPAVAAAGQGLAQAASAGAADVLPQTRGASLGAGRGATTNNNQRNITINVTVGKDAGANPYATADAVVTEIQRRLGRQGV